MGHMRIQFFSVFARQQLINFLAKIAGIVRIGLHKCYNGTGCRDNKMTPMTLRIGDEVKSNYIERMGEKLGTQFYALWQEFNWLAMKWGKYEVSYGGGSKRLDLLNEAAPTFFGMVEDVLWEDMLLHISRLTDPPASGKDKENLTIQRLPGLVEDPAIKGALQQLVDKALNASKFCLDWRNRRIAHCDLDLRINNEPARPLEPADKEKVREALIAIREVLTEFEQRRFDIDTVVYIGSITPRGAFELLPVLYFGIREQAKAEERIRCRKATEKDYPALALTDEI
jgi:AbiU2